MADSKNIKIEDAEFIKKLLVEMLSSILTDYELASEDKDRYKQESAKAIEILN